MNDINQKYCLRYLIIIGVKCQLLCDRVSQIYSTAPSVTMIHLFDLNVGPVRLNGDISRTEHGLRTVLCILTSGDRFKLRDS